ncbi:MULTISPECIES: hypothetical protein [Candidatus Ichthyocystis]|uniref:Uncharacterized protein n=1 Tax=Candidatus Ichthyocystis hellenicum TaxID=1561003 RepID=A0A0S4M1N3_9BURK|nr:MULTISPECIES: hypothetical protein [Ichthyocystis]CUT17687.1 hypothetical protein Ark11_0864 [Candidatus Ichthyocystis hellenicum]
MVDLVDNICSSFPKCAYDLRSEFINVLRHKIIPVTINGIFYSEVIYSDHEREITHLRWVIYFCTLFLS